MRRVRPTAGHRPRSTTAVRSWSGRARDRAPAGWCRRRTAWRRQHRADHQVVQRRQPPAGAADPVAQRRAIQRDALARQHLRLPIQRQRVAELADQHMRHQRLGGHAAVDRPLRRRGDHHGALAGAAGVARTARDAHPQLRGHDVQLLAAQFADRVQRAAAAGAFAAARRRSAPRSAADARAGRRGCGWGGPRAAAALVCAASAASCAASFSATVCSRSSSPSCNWSALSCSERRPNCWRNRRLISRRSLSILGIALLHAFCCCRRGDHLAQHLLQRGGIVRQGVEVDLHASIMNNAAESAPEFDQRRDFYPASSGLRRAHRRPPLAAIQQAPPVAPPTTRSAPVVVVEGQMNWPCSSRLVSMHRPMPSCQSSLISPPQCVS